MQKYQLEDNWGYHLSLIGLNSEGFEVSKRHGYRIKNNYPQKIQTLLLLPRKYYCPSIHRNCLLLSKVSFHPILNLLQTILSHSRHWMKPNHLIYSLIPRIEQALEISLWHEGSLDPLLHLTPHNFQNSISSLDFSESIGLQTGYPLMTNIILPSQTYLFSFSDVARIYCY